MKKYAALFFILFLFLCCAVPAQAREIDTAVEQSLQEGLDSLGMQELQDELSDEACKILDDLEMGRLDVGGLLSLTPGDFVQVLIKLVAETIRKPLATFGAVIGVVVLCALVGTLQTGSKSLAPVFTSVSILCVITVLVQPVTSCILGAAQTLRDCSAFMLAFIPAFTSIITISGAPVTATTYNLLLFTACQLISILATRVLVPFMGIYMGLCVAGSVGEDVGVLPLAKGVRALVTWGLSLAMTLYVGLLSMQTLVSSGADTAMMRTGKFLIGSFVPIVGGAISDALAAAQGAMRLLKTTVGAFGIVAGVATFLPMLLRVTLWYLVLKGAAFVAQALALQRLGKLLESCSNCLATLLALLVTFLLLIIISIVLLLTFSAGG